jgi:hypothetical protein
MEHDYGPADEPKAGQSRLAAPGNGRESRSQQTDGRYIRKLAPINQGGYLDLRFVICRNAVKDRIEHHDEIAMALLYKQAKHQCTQK